jgi:hypothetical protein
MKREKGMQYAKVCGKACIQNAERYLHRLGTSPCHTVS